MMKPGDVVKLKLLADVYVKVRLENHTSKANGYEEEGYFFKYLDKSILSTGWAPTYLLETIND